jgi:mannosylglycoprotein endo-beta-mannosidase
MTAAIITTLLLLGAASSEPLAWTACRFSPAHPPAALSLPGWAPPASRAACVPAAVPGTVLHALLANGTFPFASPDPYVDSVLERLLNESDIAVVGRAFYTFTFRAALPLAGVCGGEPPAAGARVVARVGQLSYRATLFVDGAEVSAPFLAPGGAVGAYRRWVWDLGDARAWCAAPGGAHALAFLVLPPDHPGNVSSSCRGCGQGGNHELAQDVTPQDAAGWDWVAGVPDRNTGLLDDVAVELAPAGVLLADPAVAVADLVLPPGAAAAAAASLTATITVSLTALGAEGVEGTLAVEVPGAGFFASAPVALAGGAQRDVALTRALRNVSLWWPHTHGAPALHDAVATFRRAGGGGAAELRFRAGFRTVGSAVDGALGGRVFFVNGERVFLAGGNFIATDALSRAELRTPAHYYDHVRMHAWAGLNVMRLWGGHGGHGRGLWDAADALGVLLLNEFWQTGDNNGRWAGSPEWPLSHGAYLAAAADTIRGARAHPSLLLHVGGNELYPLAASWAPAALEPLVAALDPRGAVFAFSSMGAGPNGSSCDSRGAACAPFDPLRVLAPTDGNYGINDEREFFLRNPGLPNHRALPIAFQPEVGSVAHPTLPSLSRFLSAGAREALPPRGSAGEGVHPAWAFHKWLPFTDGLGADHAYAPTPPGAALTAADYCLAAQLAQRAQYQALFEGFSDAAWAWYGAVIMWKSAAPWPSLRGALYDFYLAQSGGAFGARAALAAPLHAQLNRQNASLTLINRGAAAVADARVWAEAWDVETGAALRLRAPINASAPALPPRATLHLPLTLSPPPAARANATLLWRLTAASSAGGLRGVTEYLLNTLAPDAAAAPQDFSALARLRWGAPRVALGAAAACAVAPGAGGALTVTVQLALPPGARAVAVGVLATLRDGEAAATAATGFVDDRVLPQWPSDGFFAVAPGERRELSVEAAGAHARSKALRVVVEGWNVEEVSVPVSCPG